MIKSVEKKLPFPKASTVFIGGIFFILLMATLHVADDMVIPIIIAAMLKMVLLPIQRAIERLNVPRHLSALIVMLLVMGGIAAGGVSLSGPAASWAEKLPSSIPKLYERLSFISAPMHSAQKIIVKAETIAQGEGQEIVPVAVQGTRLYDRIFANTGAFMSSLFLTMVMLFFLLASGDTFLRRLVEILPHFHAKRQAVDISQQIEHDISLYLMTITFMNAMVGLLTGVALYFCGLEDAVLWGAIAFLMNYVPVLGPMFCGVLFFMVGLMTSRDIGDAVLPAVLYLSIHLSESSFITPLLLARRFTLNPVLVVMSLMFWYWMWGFPGAVLAMPMLAVIRITFERTRNLKPLGHFLAGEIKPLKPSIGGYHELR